MKFRSWNNDKEVFSYFEDGKYYLDKKCSEPNLAEHFNFIPFDWQNAEQLIEPILVNESALGCGLEDLNIIDRYDAMMYGYEQALEQIENELNIHENKELLNELQ